MSGGDIALARLPQADGSIKTRPVALLRRMPLFGDWLVCGVSTQLHQQVRDFDELVAPNDADFRQSGLKAASIIRLGFLAVLPQTKLLGVLGSVSSERHQRLLRRLATFLLS